MLKALYEGLTVRECGRLRRKGFSTVEYSAFLEP